MNNWIQTKIDVGTRDKNTEYAFEFLKTPECKPIERVDPTCDCTTAELTDTKLVVKYRTPSEVSPELIKLKIFAQAISKDINITYKDGTTETLSFYLSILD